MITCTFVGTNQYDLDLNEKIAAAVKTVISKGDEIEFLFYRRTEEFNYLCFMAVLKSKHLFPHKKITMTLLTKHGEKEEDIIWMKLRALPAWMFDKIAPVLLSPKDLNYSASPWTKIERKMVRQSDYVIACCYPALHDSEYALFRYALHQRHGSVIHLCNEKTLGFIRAITTALPPTERAIVEKRNEGCPYKDIAKEAGISIAAIQTKEGRGRRQLRARTKDRLNQERITQGSIAPGRCSVILSGDSIGESDEIRTRFLQIVGILSEKMGVTAFMVERSNRSSKCISELLSNKKLEITLVTYDLQQSQENWREVQNRYVPPFTKVWNIDRGIKPLWARYLRGIEAMLECSAYVICDLSGDCTMNDRIRRRIERQKGIIVIDLGASPSVAEPQPII